MTEGLLKCVNVRTFRTHEVWNEFIRTTYPNFSYKVYMSYIRLSPR